MIANQAENQPVRVRRPPGCLLPALVVLCRSTLGTAAIGQGIPAELEAALAARESLSTGRLHIRTAAHQQPEWSRVTQVEFSGASQILTFESRTEDKQGAPRTVRCLFQGEESWIVRDGKGKSANASRNDKNRPHAFDYRMLGMSFELPFDDGLARFRLGLGAGGEFEVHRWEEGSRVTWRIGEYTQQWYLKESAEWQPVRVNVQKNGAVIAECRSQYVQVDGVWFPRRVEYYLHDDDTGGLALRNSYEIERVELNRPELRRCFSPADLGIQPGCTVFWEDERGAEDIRIWNGTALVTQELFAEQRARGQIAETLRGNFQPAGESSSSRPAADSMPASVARWLSLRSPDVTSRWERYTREFQRRFRLSEEKGEAAFRILHDCQAQASHYLDRRREDFDALERTVATLRDQPGASQPEYEELISQYLSMKRPIDDIFTHSLKPRLYALLTRAQVEEENTPTTNQRR